MSTPPNCVRCKGCGKTGHARDTCKCTSSPYFNTQDTIYKLSLAWKVLVKEYPKIKQFQSGDRIPNMITARQLMKSTPGSLLTQVTLLVSS